MDESDSVGSELEKKIAGIVVDFARDSGVQYTINLVSYPAHRLANSMHIEIGKNTSGQMERYFQHRVVFGLDGRIKEDHPLNVASPPNTNAGIARALYKKFIVYMAENGISFGEGGLFAKWEEGSCRRDRMSL